MKIIKPLFLLLFAISCQTNLKATEIIGGSLRYEALGNQQYKVIGVVNRNCGDTSLSIPAFKVYSGSTSFALTATRTSIKDITLHCSKSSPPCNPSNTKTSEGQEQHVFEASVDFSVAPYNIFYSTGKCEVFFSMEACCRSSKTMNITANNFYLEAMLNLCMLGSSLINSNSGPIPQTYADACANLPFVYNYLYNDKDNDSVIHSIEIPKKTKDSFERFIGQFSTKYPMSPFCLPYGVINCTALPNAKPPRGFYFDGNTGDIILTPTVVKEQAIINIRTSEFRKINNLMIVIGYSTTELYINVKACTDNNPPTIPTANKWSVCEGDKLCFTIQSKDDRTAYQTTDDTTTLTWNFGIPAATFTIINPTDREKSAQFCWQTKTGDARTNTYQFTVYAKDDNCPIPGMTAKGFLITVRPKAAAIRQYRKSTGNQLKFEAYKTDTGYYNPSYEWQIRDTIGNLPLYKTFKQKDSFKFKDTGRYFITMMINNLPYNCPTVYVDTVYMNGSVTTSVEDIATHRIHTYPNPTNGWITIELKKNLHYTGMTVLNSTGQIIYNGPVESKFDMSKFAKGIYMLEINCIEGKQIAKIVMQ